MAILSPRKTPHPRSSLCPPPRPPPALPFLDRVAAYENSSLFDDTGCLVPWFHGTMSRDQANAAVQNWEPPHVRVRQPGGVFLFRYSPHQVSDFRDDTHHPATSVISVNSRYSRRCFQVLYSWCRALFAIFPCSESFRSVSSPAGNVYVTRRKASNVSYSKSLPLFIRTLQSGVALFLFPHAKAI